MHDVSVKLKYSIWKYRLQPPYTTVKIVMVIEKDYSSPWQIQIHCIFLLFSGACSKNVMVLLHKLLKVKKGFLCYWGCANVCIVTYTYKVCWWIKSLTVTWLRSIVFVVLETARQILLPTANSWIILYCTKKVNVSIVYLK